MENHARHVGRRQKAQFEQRALHARAVGADITVDHLGGMHLLGLFDRPAQQAALDHLIAGDQFDDAHIAAAHRDIAHRPQRLVSIAGDQVAGFVPLQVRDALVDVQPAKDFRVEQAALLDLDQAQQRGAAQRFDMQIMIQRVRARFGTHLHLLVQFQVAQGQVRNRRHLRDHLGRAHLAQAAPVAKKLPAQHPALAPGNRIGHRQKAQRRQPGAFEDALRLAVRGARFAKGKFDALIRCVHKRIEQRAPQPFAAGGRIDHQAPDFGDLVVIIAEIQDRRAGGHDAAYIFDHQPNNMVGIYTALDPLRVVEFGNGIIVAVIQAKKLDNLLDIFFTDGANVHRG